MNLTSPITGASQDGLTSPTFTLVSDAAPLPNGKQWAISALGGTQGSTMANNAVLPFTISVFRPAVIKSLPSSMSAVSGIIGNVPKNTNKLITRKSLAVNASGGFGMGQITTAFDIPVGASIFDMISIKSAISAHLGALQQDLDQWFQAIESGTL